MPKKKRIEKSIPGNPGISKISYLEEDTGKQLPPERGNTYIASRKRLKDLKMVKEKKAFPTLAEARRWRNSSEQDNSKNNGGKSFKEVIGNYSKIQMPTLRQSTQDSYKRLIEKYISPLQEYKIGSITPEVIDSWIEWLKENTERKTRQSFSHELDVLSGIFNFYKDYNDSFVSPILPRHRKSIKFSNKVSQKAKDLTREEFFRFRDVLKEGKHGPSMYVLATVQFFQALRISEVAALRSEDIRWHPLEENSRLKIQSSVRYPRKKGMPPEIQESFKNGAKSGGIKEQPIRPETALALKNGYLDLNKPGLLFLDMEGKLFTYREIQNAYDTAFEKAGLPYTGTHIMRHGGARDVYNRNNGDLAMTQQLLGNRDYRSALVYAQRSTNALTEFSKNEWRETKKPSEPGETPTPQSPTSETF